jgi:hypothetical protein
MSPEPAAARRAAAAVGRAGRRAIEVSRHACRQPLAAEPDVTLCSDALQMLARSPFIAIRSIRCEAHDGVLTLRGRVPSFYLKQIALATVRRSQAREVHNEVEVGIGTGRATLWTVDGSTTLPR